MLMVQRFVHWVINYITDDENPVEFSVSGISSTSSGSSSNSLDSFSASVVSLGGLFFLGLTKWLILGS